MSDWHSCIRCTWENDKCAKCGRPKGTPKNWRPESVSSGSSNQSEIEQLMAAEFKAMGKPVPTTAPTSSIPTDVSATVDLSASASTVERSPIERDSTEAPAVAAQPPFAPGKAPMGFPAILSAAPAAATVTTLAAHSPLGGSAAERYLKCPGSVRLIQSTPRQPGDDTQEEWTAEGSLAHALLEHCLVNEEPDAVLFVHGPGEWEAITPDIALAVQEALDYVRSRDGHMLVEHKFHRPELHPLYFGQADIVKYGIIDEWIEIIDYKNGAGVIVEVEHNEQLMFYANGVLGGPDFSDCGDQVPVRLTIMQPNAWHAGGKIRSWDTTAGYLRQWLRETLLPGMALTQQRNAPFMTGEHCRFCPAKLLCPAMAELAHTGLANAAVLAGPETKPKAPPGWQPVLTGEQIKLLGMLIKATRAHVFNELMTGGNVPGWKLITGRADRVWKAGAEEELASVLGEKAYATELLSPAQIEKLPGGDKLVARWAFKPEGKPTVVAVDDRGDAATPNIGTVHFAQHIQKLVANA